MKRIIKNNIAYILIVAIGVLAVFSLMLRSEQLNKKELSNSTQTEIR